MEAAVLVKIDIPKLKWVNFTSRIRPLPQKKEEKVAKLSEQTVSLWSDSVSLSEIRNLYKACWVTDSQVGFGNTS